MPMHRPLVPSWLLFGLLLVPRMAAGVEYSDWPGPDPRPPVAPSDWKVETVLRAPQVHTPSVVCALPDGRVLVAEHPLSNFGGREPIDRILCLHPDGRITVFADHLYAVFGMQYLDGKVYVHHYPVFSVFTDDNGVGADRRDIINQTGQPTIGGLNDHIAAQIRLAMDGYFYMAVGDRGVWGAKSNIDGGTVELHGGGLIRIRPDGTGLEVFATGTRNHLDVSLTPEDEMFTYDNTDDGKGWWTRFTYMVDGGYYGYPYDYRPPMTGDNKGDKLPGERDKEHPHQPYTLWRMSEYGGGSPCGAVGYAEDALPSEYHGNLFHCEWGKGRVERFVVERDGGGFKVKLREEFLKPGGDMRPLGICEIADGSGFWITDWGYGGWMNKRENVGRLLKVAYTGKLTPAPKPAWFLPAAMGKPIDASIDDLIAGLKHPARSVRMVAQRRLIDRKGAALAPLAALVKDASAPPAARWHAIWALDRIDRGASARPILAGIARDPRADPSVRRQALRQLGESRATDAAGAAASALDDADGSIRFRAATALGRMGAAATVPAIEKRLEVEQDLFTRFALFTALHRIGMADPNAWPAIVKGLESDSEALRANIGYALRNAYDRGLVETLAALVMDESRPSAARAAALQALAELHRTPQPWDGKWWGTGPVASPRPGKVVDWEATPMALQSIRAALKSHDPVVLTAAVAATRAAPDPAASEALADLFSRSKDIDIRRQALSALAAVDGQRAQPLALGALSDPGADPALAPEAVAALRSAGGDKAGAAIVAVLESSDNSNALVPALEAAGEMKLSAAAPAATKRLGSSDQVVAVAAAAALGEIGQGDGAAAAALGGALTDPRIDLRRAAAAALGRIKATSAIPALLKAAQDDATRNEAILALTRMPTTDALDVYLDALGGKNANLKQNAKSALQAIAADALPLIEAKLDKGALSPDVLRAVREAYSSFTPLLIWSIIGPFADDRPSPFDPAALTAPAGEYTDADGKTTRWKRVTADDAEHGMIDIGKRYRGRNNAAVFLFADFDSNSDRQATFTTGSDDTSIIWLNGKKVHEETASSGWQFDEAKFTAPVKKGKNTVVVKAGNHGGGWQFSLEAMIERKGKLFEASVASAPGTKPDRDAYAAFALSHEGDAARGKAIFFNSQSAGCIKCHQAGGTDGGTIGPSLVGVGAKYDRAKLVESVLYPSKQIFDGYQQSVIRTKAGDVIWGVVRSETDADLTLFDSSAQKFVIKKSDVASRKTSDASVMPQGLEQAMSLQEFADLAAFLQSLKEAVK